MLGTVTQNIPRLYTAIAEWASVALFVHLLHRNRYSREKTGILLVCSLAFQIIMQLTEGRLPRLLWVPGMIFAVVFMILMLYICCSISWRTAVYHGIRAFILAELAASLEWQLYYYLILGRRYDTLLMQVICVVLIYGLTYTGAYFVERRFVEPGGNRESAHRETLIAVLTGTVVFTFSNLSFLNTATPFSSNSIPEIFNIRTLIDFAGYLILLMYHMQLEDMFTRYERDTMETMLHSQLMQYKLSRESIDLVNRKYHDLKHQIGVLRAETDDNVRNAYLDEMEEEIRIYEAQYKTGNKILDTILTSQTLYCIKHSIELNCIADGKLLDFLDVMDICTIFGNALDNAVECELKIKDKEKRFIRLQVFQQKQFVIVSVMNYCEENVIMEKGLPITTKNDHYYHGFGVKSIQNAAEKYDGVISVNYEKNWFKLLIMLPIKQS